MTCNSYELGKILGINCYYHIKNGCVFQSWISPNINFSFAECRANEHCHTKNHHFLPAAEWFNVYQTWRFRLERVGRIWIYLNRYQCKFVSIKNNWIWGIWWFRHSAKIAWLQEKVSKVQRMTFQVKYVIICRTARTVINWKWQRIQSGLQLDLSTAALCVIIISKVQLFECQMYW